MRTTSVAFFALWSLVLACGPSRVGPGGDGDANVNVGPDGTPDACVGLQCKIPDCTNIGNGTTSLSGYVYAPNGTLPLFGVNVYVPNSDPGTITPGLDNACDQCSTDLPGSPVVKTTTDEHGHFSLPGIPVDSQLPVVVQIGKWRKILALQTTLTPCMDNPLPSIDTTLPTKRTDTGGDVVSVSMPQIAISTGSADALECLVRKLGISDEEITGDTGAGRVHLFSGNGAKKFDTGFVGGSGTFAASTTLWDTYDKLKQYDVVMFSCESGQHPETKSQDAMNAVKLYADMGGRVFLSHWHNIWIEGAFQNGTQAPMVWPSIATFTNGDTTLSNNTSDTIDTTNNPKGQSFATWMLDPHVMGSTVADLIPIADGSGKNTCSAIDETKGERWVYLDGSNDNAHGVSGVQNFQFTTPNEDPVASRCGKVVFSDMHVSGDSTSDPHDAYPTTCSTQPLTPQEKALAFMFFDIESCVTTTIP